MKDIVIVSVLFALLSCSTSDKKNTSAAIATRDTLEYKPVHEAREHLSVVSAIGIPSYQVVNINCVVRNSLSKTVEINFDNFELITADGKRSVPVHCIPAMTELKPGDSATFVLAFKPLNDLRLYQETGLRGDLTDRYTLQFKADDEAPRADEITITTDVAVYNATLEKFGFNKTVLPYVANLSEAFRARQKKHADSVITRVDRTRSEGSVTLKGNELLVNGVWVKTEAYYRKDSIISNIRIVNKSGSSLVFNPASFRLIAGQKQIAPAVAKDSVITIRDGGRESYSYSFSSSREETLALSLQGLVYETPSTPSVFVAPIPFKAYQP